MRGILCALWVLEASWDRDTLCTLCNMNCFRCIVWVFWRKTGVELSAAPIKCWFACMWCIKKRPFERIRRLSSHGAVWNIFSQGASCSVRSFNILKNRTVVWDFSSAFLLHWWISYVWFPTPTGFLPIILTADNGRKQQNLIGPECGPAGDFESDVAL